MTSDQFILENESLTIDSLKILPAADLMNSYIPLLEGKRIAVVANQTTVVSNGSQLINTSYTHLIDTLLTYDINIQKVFAPEHGFRGKIDKNLAK